jgi:hypothetical protein
MQFANPSSLYGRRYNSFERKEDWDNGDLFSVIVIAVNNAGLRF